MSTENKMKNIVIVNTGCANLASVKFAIERLGYQAIISDDVNQIKNAGKVILPGVGSAQHAMKNIINKGLVETIQKLKQPVLGFCLGMQLMTLSSNESSEIEDSTVECLGLIPTQITTLDAGELRLPHMGWNTLTTVSDHPVFKGIQAGEYFYFVHSFAAPVNKYTVAQCQYGSDFSAAIAKDNFIGCQFHPERSGKMGLQIIKNFIEM